jgi:hypothetical protein
MFEYFYHEILRKTIIGFGTLFNNIEVRSKDNSGDTFSIVKVPLAYGPSQKFLARLEQQPDLNNPFQITLPRMSFEFVGLSYDTSRKLNQTQTFLAKSSANSEIKKVYMPVPYNMDFELNIMTKINDDMLQIVEQILPYFQPAFTITVNLLDTLGENKDIPIVLNSITMNDDYEGNFQTRRSLIYTLRFTAKTFLFGPASSGVGKDIIKKVSVGYISGDSKSTARDLTYSVEPIATKNYTGQITTILRSDVLTTDSSIIVNDASNISIGDNFTLNLETLKALKIDGDTILVERGSYGTSISNHVSGSELKLITSQDNNLIQLGDDFGFSGSFE